MFVNLARFLQVHLNMICKVQKVCVQNLLVQMHNRCGMQTSKDWMAYIAPAAPFSTNNGKSSVSCCFKKGILNAHIVASMGRCTTRPELLGVVIGIVIIVIRFWAVSRRLPYGTLLSQR